MSVASRGYWPHHIDGAEVVNPKAEVRITDPDTGGQKGSKIERFSLIPAEVSRQDALVYGAGATKYDDNNWRKGYKWSLSIDALERHFNAWKRGESYDAELSRIAGRPVSHLTCVRWHSATLYVFEHDGLGTDDRPSISDPAKVSG